MIAEPILRHRNSAQEVFHILLLHRADRHRLYLGLRNTHRKKPLRFPSIPWFYPTIPREGVPIPQNFGFSHDALNRVCFIDDQGIDITLGGFGAVLELLLA